MGGGGERGAEKREGGDKSVVEEKGVEKKER